MHLAHAAWNAIAMLYFGMRAETDSDIEKALECFKESIVDENNTDSNASKAEPDIIGF